LLDGILYPSSISKPGTCVALFIGHDDLYQFRPEPLPIELLTSSITHVQEDRAKPQQGNERLR
jgi:hypothetical protein